VLHASEGGVETGTEKVWTLEGELRVHPKSLYRYYLIVLDGQKCALYGADHSRDPEDWWHKELPARGRGRGLRGAEQRVGGTNGHPSPLPAGWCVYMDVHEVEVLK